jgi:outer membrane lipoprotein carrier protein
MRFSSLAAAVLLALASRVIASAPLPAQSVHEIAASLQKKYDSVKDFTADFEHTYEGGVLRKRVTEKGTVQIKKPGMMRWIYKEPQRKEFVSDGRRVYVYLPADKQVMVDRVPQEDEATSAVLFLAGKGNLTRDFAVTQVPTVPTDAWGLKLMPKVKDRDYDWLELVVDRATFQIRALSFEDKGGRSTFRFSNFKENTGLSDKIFVFKIPAGADVITNGSTAR